MSERESELLRALRPLLSTHMEEIEGEFYNHLLRFPDTAHLLQDTPRLASLREARRTFLLRITDGVFDDSYFENRLQLGRAHELVGLTPYWYLGGHVLQLNLLMPLVFRYFAPDYQRVQDTLAALEKVFMLDASLAIDGWISSDRYRHLRQLESIVNDSADVIIMLDNEKQFRAWNRAAERIFGWSAEDVLGQHVNLIIPPDLLKAGELARIDQEVERSGFCHLETFRQAKDGRRVPVDLTLSVLHDPQGQAIGRSVIVRDITERNRLEQAKLQAERLATIGAMSAKLAHEIRNPLSSITLNLDLVRDEIESLARDQPAAGEEGRSLLRSIGAEVRRIQRVTEDYLQFARLPKLRQERVDLNDLLRHGLEFLRTLFDSAGVTVQTDFDLSLRPIQADESQLWQAILNLIRNALEAMPEGGELVLATRQLAGQVALTLSDSGKGMGPAELAQVFRPFFSTKVGGTGLGLPLTQQIVTEHGGTIACESEPGKGTSFTIHLIQNPES